MEGNLSIQNVTKYYKDFKAVDDVSLEVHKGEFLTILGPSGSGKSTLLNMIAGFEDLNNGTILLNDENIAKKKPYERNIGMVFQNYALFPHMTIDDNIAYPLRRRKVNKKEIEKRVDEVLKIIKLEEHKNKYPNQLSGGQQQRVALARAIVFNPPLLLLDEPLGALDKQLRQQMQLEIKNIQKSVGITTISVTHDQEEALTMSDRICVMNNGKIEQVDTPTNIYQYPKNYFVAKFIGEINLLEGSLVENNNGKVTVKLLNDNVAEVHVENQEQALGKEVYVAVRPENLQFSNENSPRTNTIEAQVLEKIYLGESILVRLLTSQNEEVKIKVHSSLSNSITIGETRTLEWDKSAATVIPKE